MKHTRRNAGTRPFLFCLLTSLLLTSLISLGHASAKNPAPAGPSSVLAGQPSVPARQLPAGLHVPDRIWAGEAFLVSFDAAGVRALELKWKGKKLVLRPRQGEALFQVLLAVSLTEKAGSLPLGIKVLRSNGAAEQSDVALSVSKRSYPVQRLTVEQKYVTPPQEVQQRIKLERAQLRAVINNITPTRYWSLPMLRPVPGEVTSLYGLRRVFNGQERDPHKGVDFDASEGDPVAVMDQGTVALVAEHYYNGNIVVVDHGLGVYSLYLHLSAFTVKQGQQLKRGDIVGLIGSTGRATGPHLHLSFSVLGDMVNGAACMDM